MLSRRALTAALLLAPGACAPASPQRVVMATGLGDIVLELYPGQAPVTAGNFLRYVDSGSYKGARFYRVVRPDNDHNPATITVVQGGLDRPDDAPTPFPPIVHEPTGRTGILHTDGVISMARGAPGTAACEFFICLGDNPALDEGGARFPDRLGFAAFGKVMSGMETVRAINGLRDAARLADLTLRGQILARPVPILSVRRQT